MTLQYTIQRYWLNFKRYRMFFSLAIIVFAVLAVLITLIYPGPAAIDLILGVPAFALMTGISDVQNPGLLVWILIMFSSLLLTIFYPVVGIFFGANILPFNEKEGKELIFSTEKSLLWYFLENLLLVLIVIPVAVLPAFLIEAGFLLSSAGSGDLIALIIAFILPVFFVYVVAMVTSLGCAIKSSPKIGYAFGGIFFIVSFTLNLLQQEIDFAKDINLMSQVGAFEHAIAGTWNEEFILKCLLLMALLVILTVFFLYRTDYIETRSSYKETVGEEDTRGIRGIAAKGSFIRTPIESVLSWVGWKNPVFRDQLQATAGIGLIYAFVTSLLVVVICLFSYPGDEVLQSLFTEMEAILDSPVFVAFMFGHEGAITATFGGFLVLKFLLFHWIFYGPFLFIMTYNIIMRDSSAGYDEITWSMPRTRPRVITKRTIAALVYLWLILFFNYVTLWGAELIRGVAPTDFVATTLTFIYLGIGYSLFLVLFVALASIPHPKYLLITVIGVFLIALFIPIVYNLNQDLSWFLYLSPFYYFDVVGLMLNDIHLEQVIPETIIYGAVITMIFIATVKYWVPKRDIV